MSESRPDKTNPLARACACGAVALVWVVLDQWTKGLFTGGQPGDSYGSLLGGLVDIRLVHNTGAAWGLFADNTAALGAFSLLVVGVLAAYLTVSIRSLNALQLAGIALVAAGGVGNAIDRFAQGYVTDFIAVTFVDFPVFNVADIGVTCGVALLLAGFAVSWRNGGGER